MEARTCFIFLTYSFCLKWMKVAGQEQFPYQKPEIYHMHITSDIKYRFATTLVVSKVRNANKKAEEVAFDVTLPKEAFITNFTMDTDQRVYVGEVKEKEQAKQEFERAKSQGQSAGHIAAAPRETNKFNIRINVEAESEAIFRLTYQELLKRVTGKYRHVIYVNPGEPIKDFKIRIGIQESRDIMQLDANADFIHDQNLLDPNLLITVDRTSAKSAEILFSPTYQQQEMMSSKGISGEFQLSYDVTREKDAGDVLIFNGYFIHFFAPNDIEPLPKDILIVLDKSGSMTGRKIAQLKTAILRILDDISENDRFNVLFFDSSLTWFKSGVMVYGNKENILDAKAFISKTLANGGTNIDTALSEGLKVLMTLLDQSRSPLVMFLTDGEPTVGETTTSKIISNVNRINEINAPIFSLAFGEGADYNFLKVLSAQNNGFARKIYEDSDADLQIENLYKEISTALLRNITFSYLANTVERKSVTQTVFPIYFKGSELVVAGKLIDAALPNLKTSVYGLSFNGRIGLENSTKVVNLKLTSGVDFEAITEKMWAFLTIKQLINDLDKDINETTKDEIKRKILQMSLKYQFVTPLTSMVVTKPLIESRPLPVRPWDLSSTRLLAARPAAISPGGSLRTFLGGRMPTTAMMFPTSRMPAMTASRRPSFGMTTRPTTTVSTRMTTVALAKANICRQYQGNSSPDVFIHLEGSKIPLCMKLPFQPDPLQQDDYLLLKDKDNTLTANIRRCMYGLNQTTNLIEAVNIQPEMFMNMNGITFKNGSKIDWKSAGERYKWSFKSLSTKVEIITSNGPIRSLEVHAFVPFKGKASAVVDGVLNHFIGMKVKRVKARKSGKSKTATINIVQKKRRIVIKNAKLLQKISRFTSECWLVENPEKQLKINVTSFRT